MGSTLSTSWKVGVEAIGLLLLALHTAHITGETHVFEDYPVFVRALALIGLGVICAGLYSILWMSFVRANRWPFYAGGVQPKGWPAFLHTLCLMFPFFGCAVVVTYPHLLDEGLANRLLGILAATLACIVSQFLVYGTQRFPGARTRIVRDERRRTEREERRVLLVYAFLSIVPACVSYRYVTGGRAEVLDALIPSMVGVLITWLVGSLTIRGMGLGRGSTRWPDDFRGGVVGISLSAGLILGMFF